MPPWVAVFSRRAGPFAVGTGSAEAGAPAGPAARGLPAPGREARVPAPPGSLPCPPLCDVHTPGKGNVATGAWAAGGSRGVSLGSEVPTCPRTSVSVHASPRCVRVCGVRGLGRVSAGLASWGPSPPGQCASLPPGGVHPTHPAESDVRSPPGRGDCGEVAGHLGLSLGPSVGAAGGKEGRPRDQVSRLPPSSVPRQPAGPRAVLGVTSLDLPLRLCKSLAVSPPRMSPAGTVLTLQGFSAPSTPHLSPWLRQAQSVLLASWAQGGTPVLTVRTAGPGDGLPPSLQSSTDPRGPGRVPTQRLCTQSCWL